MMSTENIALAISIASAVIASLSLGWNIYRDVVLRARVRVSFSIVSIIHESLPDRPRYLSISATNFGPGPVTLSMPCAKNAPLWRRIARKTKHAVINPDYTNPLSGKLPKKVEVGDKLDLLLPYKKDCLLHARFTHVGLSDYFGRMHWAPRAQLKAAYRQYHEEFGS